MIELKSPLSLVWEITNDCNLLCPHCRASISQKSPYNRKIEDKILDEILQNQILTVNLSGGEPLLHPRINEFVRCLSANNVYVAISTNGWLYENFAESLKKDGLEFIQISVDGPKNIHDEFRGIDGAFDRAMKALRLAKELGHRTQMNVTITSHNIDTLLENIELAENAKVDNLFFRRAVPSGRGQENRYILPPKQKFLQMIQNLSKIKSKKLKIIIDEPLVNIFKNLDLKQEHLSCGAGVKSLGISSVGDIYPCIFLRHKIGNITQNSLEYVWKNSEILFRLRNRDIETCKDCDYCNVCSGCRAYSGIFSVDEMCPFSS